MHRSIILSILLVMVLFTSLHLWAFPNVGDVAPNVRYQDIDTGEELWLYDEYYGSIVVIECFATW
ncbi:MAG: hypothetical protein DRH70_03415 [Candidatus Coatesbacteria bacterium]|nr:MAG: hypothetical protein DRH70_03415 [Candidatus Coatesbacteria bacterium]